MAKAYVKTEYTDKDGTHKVGDQVDLPRDTDEQKEGFDTLVRTGVITTRKSDIDETPDPDEDGENLTVPQTIQDGAATTAGRRGAPKEK